MTAATLQLNGLQDPGSLGVGFLKGLCKMTSPIDETHNGANQPSFWRRPIGMALETLALIAGFFLLREHWGHVLGLWPYLLLLACPLMHLMHGHGGHGHGSHADHQPDPGRATSER